MTRQSQQLNPTQDNTPTDNSTVKQEQTIKALEAKAGCELNRSKMRWKLTERLKQDLKLSKKQIKTKYK